MPIRRGALEAQADRIEAILAQHRVPGQIDGGVVTPRMVQYHLCTPLGVKVGKVAALAEELALALGCRDVRIYRREGM